MCFADRDAAAAKAISASVVAGPRNVKDTDAEAGDGKHREIREKRTKMF